MRPRICYEVAAAWLILLLGLAWPMLGHPAVSPVTLAAWAACLTLGALGVGYGLGKGGRA